MNIQKTKHKLLIVDDQKSIRISLQDILSDDYDCIICSSASHALSVLDSEKIDLLLTDIRMPGINGIELIRQAKENDPNLICVLMTAYNTNEYLYYVRVEKIKNIVPKASMSDILGFRILLRKLLKEINIFGISHYFPDITHQKITIPDLSSANLTNGRSVFTLEIENLKDYRKVGSLIWDFFLTHVFKEPMVSLVLEELCSNVMQHLYFQKKIPLEEDFEIDFQPTFELSFGQYGNAIIIRVLDKKGILNQETILKTLEDQINSQKQNQYRLHMEDRSYLESIIRQGRGLHLSRELSDRLIFNIQRNVKTEVIAIMLKEKIIGSAKSYSSLFIFEDPS